MTEREWHTATEKDFAEAEKECEREFCREHGRSPVDREELKQWVGRKVDALGIVPPLKYS
jgi:hypothetical protein